MDIKNSSLTVEEKQAEPIQVDTIKPLNIKNSSLTVEEKQAKPIQVDTIKPLTVKNSSMVIEKKQTENINIDTIKPVEIANSSLNIEKKKVEEIEIDTIQPLEIPKIDIPFIDMSAVSESKKEYNEFFEQIMEKYEKLPEFKSTLDSIFESAVNEMKVQGG